MLIRRQFEISRGTDQILRDSPTFAETKTKTILSSANSLIRCLFEPLRSTDQICGNSPTFDTANAIQELITVSSLATTVKIGVRWGFSQMNCGTSWIW
jgi:hypothetical protein